MENKFIQVEAGFQQCIVPVRFVYCYCLRWVARVRTWRKFGGKCFPAPSQSQHHTPQGRKHSTLKLIHLELVSFQQLTFNPCLPASFGYTLSTSAIVGLCQVVLDSVRFLSFLFFLFFTGADSLSAHLLARQAGIQKFAS